MTGSAQEEAGIVRFALVITDDGQLINNTVHDTRAERRDACAEIVKATCNAYAREVNLILLKFGGAHPDGAVAAISALYAGTGIDIYLEDQPVPEQPVAGVPVAMYSILQSYENRAQNALVHFPTTEARQNHMRQQLNNLGAAVPPDDTFTDEELRERVQRTLNGLLDQQVSVHLATSFAPNWL